LISSTHNTFLLREASQIFETNSTRPINFQIEDIMRPVVVVQPDLDIVRTTQASGTVFTTPVRNDFFLTNIWLSNTADGVSYVDFITEDGIAQRVQLAGGASGLECTATHIQFPLRGVKLQKNSAISCNISATGSVMIAGYRGSDRS